MGRCMANQTPLKRKTIAIIAPTGMLGSMVYKELQNKYNLVVVYRDTDKFNKLKKNYGYKKGVRAIKFDLNLLYNDYIDSFYKSEFGPQTNILKTEIGKVDAVINCAGITKPHSLKNPLMTMFINGYVPHVLSRLYGSKLIQIATDCVYNGISGAPYNENSPMSPNDLYGFSKSMGEPKGSLVIRTSIIGPEIEGFNMLLEWFKKQKNQKVTGYTNHLWNGITTKQFAVICDKIISKRKDYPISGVYHVFSNSVSKYQMLVKFNKKFAVKAKIIPSKAKSPVDRRLTSIHSFCRKLNIPNFDEMLQDL